MAKRKAKVRKPKKQPAAKALPFGGKQAAPFGSKKTPAK